VISIRKAGPGDLFSIFDILRGSGLPTEGVDEILARFLVADQEGRIVATAGIELGEECALLRSVAVVPEARGTGLGVEIVRQALRLASLSGAGTVYLLTTSARGFFERFGFRPALRAEIEAKFPDSAETSPDGACTTAEAMALRDLSSVLDPRPRR
jgi:amino-acid N-acetyltransferase